jgi:hypothetical protein
MAAQDVEHTPREGRWSVSPAQINERVVAPLKALEAKAAALDGLTAVGPETVADTADETASLSVTIPASLVIPGQMFTISADESALRVGGTPTCTHRLRMGPSAGTEIGSTGAVDPTATATHGEVFSRIRVRSRSGDNADISYIGRSKHHSTAVNSTNPAVETVDVSEGLLIRLTHDWSAAAADSVATGHVLTVVPSLAPPAA